MIGFWLVHLFSRPDILRRGIEELLGAAATGAAATAQEFIVPPAWAGY